WRIGDGNGTRPLWNTARLRAFLAEWGIGRCPEEAMMKTTKLLTTTAAVLFVAGGVAWAQNAPKGDAPAPDRAPAAQQHAPAEKVAPSMRSGDRKGSVTTGQDQGEKIQSNQNKTQVQEKSNLNDKSKGDERGANRDMKHNDRNANTENRDRKTGAKVDEHNKTGAKVD